MNKQQISLGEDFPKMFGVNLLLMTGSLLTFGVTSLWIKSFGASGESLGLALSGFTLTALVSRYLTGKWLMKHSAKPFARFTGLAITVVVLMYALIPENVVAVSLLRLLYGILWGMLTTVLNAWLTRYVQGEARARGVGIFRMGLSFALAIGPAAGIFLYRSFGIQGVAIASGMVSLPALALLFWIKASGAPKSVSLGEDNSDAPRASAALKLHILLMMCTLGIAHVSVLYYLPLYFEGRGIFGWTELYLFLQAIFSALAGWFVAKVYGRKLSAAHLLGLGFVLLALSFWLLTVSEGLAGLFVASALLGIGYQSVFATGQVVLVSMFSHQEQGRANALLFNSFDVGISSGSVIIGVLTESVSYEVIYIGIALLSLLMSITTLRFRVLTSQFAH